MKKEARDDAALQKRMEKEALRAQEEEKLVKGGADDVNDRARAV